MNTTVPAYQLNGQPVSAEAFYAVACNPQRPVAVEACAGAGKTWMLVSRIVRALLEGIDPQTGDLRVLPHEILAITFTKRAAGEMRERLLEWLAEFSHADDDRLAQELKIRGYVNENDPLPSSRLRSSLSKLYQNMLATGRQVQIRTFHSWFAALLRNAPLAVLQQLNLPAQYELLEDDNQAKALVWRRFYAALNQDPPRRADFEAVVQMFGRFQAEKALQTALDKRQEFTLADAHGVVEASVTHFADQYPEFRGCAGPEDFIAADPGRRQLFADAARLLGRASAPTFSAKGVELEKALADSDWSAAFAALLTEKGTPRKFGEKIVGIEHIRLAQELALQVVAARHQHEAWRYQQCMARLSRVMIAEFGALKRQQQWVDMNDVENAAKLMLGHPVLGGWVQQRLDARIKHLLIDEFQDTSPLQWQSLLSWLSSYGGSGGGNTPSVFIVGDPKQSIYRFRRAEPQVFKAAKAFVRDGLGGDVLSCDHTRRNATQVIGTVNAAMLAACRANEYDGFRPHTTGSAEAGQVCRLPQILRGANQAGGKDEADDSAYAGAWRDSLTTPQTEPEETLRSLEARQAAAWIAAQVARGTAPKDIMVLSRKRAGLAPMQDELRTLGVPAQMSEKIDLIEFCEVLDIVALLDVLVSPQHDLSLARVLKSPLFGVPDAALIELAILKSEQGGAWIDLLQKQELLTPELRGLSAILTRWKTWVGALPPHDALQAIYTDGDVLARFAMAAPAIMRPAVLANLRALLAVALQLAGGRFATPYALVRALKAGGVQANAPVVDKATRLLTIHAAKGLEAKVVLLLDTDSNPRTTQTMGVLVDWPGEAPYPQKFIFLASESRPPACAEATLAAELAERQREELNALYVALTRARHTLVISSIEPFRAGEDSWWARLNSLGLDVEDLDVDCAANPAMDSRRAEERFELPIVPLALVNQASSAMNNEANENSAELDIAPDSIASRIGQAMHRLVEWGDASPQNTTAAAREFELTPAQGDEAAVMAQRILQGEGAWVWRSDLLAWQGNEVELMYQGEPLRLDRLVQCKDTLAWWVLEYKSSASPQDDPDLLDQLSSYRDAVQAIYPDQVVRAAFLTGQGRVVELPVRGT